MAKIEKKKFHHVQQLEEMPELPDSTLLMSQDNAETAISSAVASMTREDKDEQMRQAVYESPETADLRKQLLNHVDKSGTPKEIPINTIDDFPDHPYVVEVDDEMKALQESISKFGVLNPVTVRKLNNGRYQMISGHRRKLAAKLNDLDMIPAIVVDMTDAEATVAMVDSNLYRENILPSSKAKAYKMKADAIAKEPAVFKTKFGTGRATSILAAGSPDSDTGIRIYLKLNELIPEIMSFVDSGKIPVRAGYHLAFLNSPSQKELLSAILQTSTYPNMVQAESLHAAYDAGKISSKESILHLLVAPSKSNSKITFKAAEISKYIPSNVPEADYTKYILKALKFYQAHSSK